MVSPTPFAWKYYIVDGTVIVFGSSSSIELISASVRLPNEDRQLRSCTFVFEISSVSSSEREVSAEISVTLVSDIERSLRFLIKSVQILL